MKSEKGAKSRQSTTLSLDALKLPFRNSIHWQRKTSEVTKHLVLLLF